MQKIKFYTGPISADMHQAIIELAALADFLPQEHAPQARQLLRGLLEATERVSGLETATLLDVTPIKSRAWQ